VRRTAVRDGARIACAVFCCACSSAVAPPTFVAPAAPVRASAPVAALHNRLPALDPSQFLSALSLDVSNKLESGTLELLAPSYAGSDLGELDARKLILQRGAGGRFLVRASWPGYAASTLPVNEREKRCSFVADCDEPAVIRAEALLRRAHPSPTASNVVEFVSQFIEHKHMSRGFDIASVVAEKREGDCTEHAVLTAALLRVSGFPSHIVIGVVVVQTQGKLLAFGHAWTEYHDGKSWQLADATNMSRQPMAYLALRVMHNESVSYGRDAFAGFNVVDITSLSVPQGLTLAAAR